jgi:hypothetical protein
MIEVEVVISPRDLDVAPQEVYVPSVRVSPGTEVSTVYQFSVECGTSSVGIVTER